MPVKKKQPKLNVFIQEHSGDFNLDVEVSCPEMVNELVGFIRERGGYWTEGNLREFNGSMGSYFLIDVGGAFIPWHRIDRIEVRSEE